VIHAEALALCGVALARIPRPSPADGTAGP
jgi:hypothetical protein